MSSLLRRTLLSVLALLTGGLLTAVSGSPAHAVDRDCSDFASQRAAQVFFLNHGGPQSDPHRLDADGDSIACESNPPPYYYGTTPPGSSPHQPPVLRSVVRLQVVPGRAIAGEPLLFRAQVLPRVRRAVVLQRQRPAGGWARVDAGRTALSGRVSFRSPTRAVTTTYRAVVTKARLGGRRYSAARSPLRRVVTQRQSVTLALPSTATSGATLTAVVSASPVRRGRPVVLQRRTPMGWSPLATGRESRSGRVRFTVSARTAGSFVYRATVQRYRGAGAAASPGRRLLVTPPPDTTPPPAPQGLTAMPGDRQVELRWSAVPAEDLAGYVVYYSSAGGGWTAAARVDGTTAVVSGLSNGTQYWFAVSSVDTTGNESGWSAQRPATPVAPPDTTAPPAPASLVASAGDGEATLAWSTVDAPDLAGYLVYGRVAPDGEWLPVGDGPTLASVLTVPNLVNGTRYDFVVTAVDASGNESIVSPAASATPVAAPVDP